ncbi:hypothetical protein CPB85DRAFT_1440572 [Mucidula mucida]|nr:hypothetical protein CPB85DRAFT_1440572 [Mucidula mucida]
MTSLTQFPLTTNFLTLAASLAKQHHIAVSWQREAVYLGVSNRRLLQASRRSPPRYRYAFGMYLKFPSVPTLGYIDCYIQYLPTLYERLIVPDHGYMLQSPSLTKTFLEAMPASGHYLFCWMG